jgi:hypothetical protein
MIKEDYVSFETAKLLKENGFDWETHRSYLSNDNVFVPGDVSDLPYRKDAIRISTLQMAMKWLREVHNLVIEPYRTACGYLYTISSIPYGSTKYDNSQEFNGDDEDSGQWTTWEMACEDGIKYCLENLI